MTTTTACRLAETLGLAPDHADYAVAVELDHRQVPAAAVTDAITVGLSLTEILDWVRYMHVDAFQTCLDAGMDYNMMRATLASKHMPDPVALDRLRALRHP